MTTTPDHALRTAIGSRGHAIAVGLTVTAAYAVIAAIAGLQVLMVESRNGQLPRIGPIMGYQFLAIAPWLPATALIFYQTRRAFRHHRVIVAVLALGVLGLAVVGTINLIQAALLTTFGSWYSVPWLDQYADGLVASGHFGFLWYVVVTLAAYAFITREPRTDSPPVRPPHEYPGAIEVGSGQARVILRPEAIDWIEARGDYVRVHAGGRGYLKLERMKALEDMLDPATFARVHRSAIVNLDRVREFVPIRRGDYHLVLESGERLRLARSRREAVLARLRARSR